MQGLSREGGVVIPRESQSSERLIWDAETERDYPEPMSPGEEARLDDWAEHEMERNWP